LKFDLLLYAVTDRAWTGTKTLADQIEEALKAGVTMVQLREKELAADAFLEEAKLVKRITDAYGVPLIIDDHVAVALACDAAGVHIGQDDMDVAAVRRLGGRIKSLGLRPKQWPRRSWRSSRGLIIWALGRSLDQPRSRMPNQ